MAPVTVPGSRRIAEVALRLLGDQQLARLAARGDTRAFAVVYERHHQDLYRYCRSITRDDEDASDALQSTMAAALRALPGERREIALRPWLFRIAHNEAVSIVRRRRPHAELTDVTVGVAPGSDHEAGVRDQVGRILTDIGDLPQRQRGALLMRELSGLEYGEIGSALGISSGAARQAVYEARTALHELDDGRSMRCDAARTSLSARDARMLRGRRLRAHLRACHSCSDFNDQLGLRRTALRALVPPLPAASGALILGGVVGAAGAGMSAGGLSAAGGAGGAVSALGSLLTPSIGGSAALKGAATVAVAVAAGVGTVEVATHHEAPPARGPAAVAQLDRVNPATGVDTAIGEETGTETAAVEHRGSDPAGGARPREDGAGAPAAAEPAPQRRTVSAPAPRRGIVPVQEPGAPAAEAPAPAAPEAQAPATTTPAQPVQSPAQQQYDRAISTAQQSIQLGRQTFTQAMSLAQNLMNQVLGQVFGRR